MMINPTYVFLSTGQRPSCVTSIIRAKLCDVDHRGQAVWRRSSGPGCVTSITMARLCDVDHQGQAVWRRSSGPGCVTSIIRARRCNVDHQGQSVWRRSSGPGCVTSIIRARLCDIDYQGGMGSPWAYQHNLFTQYDTRVSHHFRVWMSLRMLFYMDLILS
jgi:hypothetical protein